MRWTRIAREMASSFTGGRRARQEVSAAPPGEAQFTKTKGSGRISPENLDAAAGAYVATRRFTSRQ